MDFKFRIMDEVIITEHDESFFRWEAEKYKLKIKRTATSYETTEYVKEYNNLRKEAEQTQHEMYYHDLPD